MADSVYRKMGEIYAEKGDYYPAIEAFETVFENGLRDTKTRRNCIDASFKAGLCHIGTQVSASG